MPRISVLITSRDRPEWLHGAVRSTLEQDLEDFELIVVDDGSTGGCCRDVVSRFTDPRIRLYRNTGAHGPSPARNLGLRQARGPLVSILDDDDLMLPGRLRAAHEAFSGDDRLVLCGAAYRVIDESGKDLCTIRPPGDVDTLLRVLRSENPFCHSTLTFRLADARAIGGYRESLPYAEDYDLILRLSERGSIACLPVPAACHRVHSHSLSTSSGIRNRAYLDLVKESARERARGTPESIDAAAMRIADSPEPCTSAQDEVEQEFRLGELLYRGGHFSRARLHLKKGLSRLPLRPVPWGLLIATYLPAGARALMARLLRPYLIRRYPRWIDS